MNTNRIRIDGFSNPETERYFRSWPATVVERYSERDKQCAFCEHCFFLRENLALLLCLNPDSPHCHETVEIWFTCPRHESKKLKAKSRNGKRLEA